MCPIVFYPDDQAVFTPETTHGMATVLDAVCRELHVPETALEERQIIAARILDLARGGVTDVETLRSRVLSEARRTAA